MPPFRVLKEIEKAATQAQILLCNSVIDLDARAKATKHLENLFTAFGPPVEEYPVWHPLAAMTQSLQEANTLGEVRPTLLRDAVLVPEMLGSIAETAVLEYQNFQGGTLYESYIVTIDDLEPTFPPLGPKPRLVRLQWPGSLCEDGTVPIEYALTLLMFTLFSQRNPRNAFGKDWRNVAGKITGRPAGTVTSLFVNKDTGYVLRAEYERYQKLIARC